MKLANVRRVPIHLEKITRKLVVKKVIASVSGNRGGIFSISRCRRRRYAVLDKI